MFYRMLKCMRLQTAVETRKSSHVIMATLRFQPRQKFSYFGSLVGQRKRYAPHINLDLDLSRNYNGTFECV